MAMKDSGFDWIGEIPNDWEVSIIKSICSLKGRIGWQGLTSEEYCEEGPYLITGVDFDKGGIDWENCEHVPEFRYKQAIDIQIKNNDLLITKDGTVGKVAIVSDCPEQVTLNSGVLLIRPLKQDYLQKFLYYVLLSNEFWHWFEITNLGATTITHLYQNVFAKFKLVIPKTFEQKLIADFLDDKVGKIDDILADLNKQVEILTSYKKSLITETVTKGLNPNAPMKDSGIDWIGEIPEHWDIKKLKYLLKPNCVNMRVGPFGSALSGDDFKDEGYWIYNQRCVLDKNFETNDTFVDEYKYKELNAFTVDAGDMLITTRGTIGKVAIVPKSCPIGILHPCIIKFVLNQDLINNELVELIFNNSNMIMDQIMRKSNATTIDVIYSYTLKDLLLPVIPMNEQKEIIDFLNKKCTEIDDLIADKTAQIEKMEKYKKSLIFEYVTGKKRVKEVV